MKEVRSGLCPYLLLCPYVSQLLHLIIPCYSPIFCFGTNYYYYFTMSTKHRFYNKCVYINYTNIRTKNGKRLFRFYLDYKRMHMWVRNSGMFIY